MKEIDIFSIVPENYFSILSSPNKFMYIKIIYNFYTQLIYLLNFL